MRNGLASLRDSLGRNSGTAKVPEPKTLPEDGAVATKRSEFDEALSGEYLSTQLAEYGWLVAEIRGRSEFQHRIVQIHITALTLLLTGGVSGAFSRWVLIAIPFESALFGLWWLDHASTIRDIGRYLSDTVEPKIDRILAQPDVIGWHRRLERKNEKRSDLNRIIRGYRSVSGFTFIAPSISIIAICMIGTIATFGRLPDGEFWDKLEKGYDVFFPLAAEFLGYRPWILLAATIVGSWLFVRYFWEYLSFAKLIRKH